MSWAGCLSGYTYPSPSPAPELSFPSSSPSPSITYASSSKAQYSESAVTYAKTSEEKHSSQSPSSKYAAVVPSGHGYPTSSGLSDYTTSTGVSSYVRSDSKPNLEYLPPVQKTKVVVSQPQPAVKYSSASAVSNSYSTSSHGATKLAAVGPSFVPVAPAEPIYKTHYETVQEPVAYAVQASPSAQGEAYVSKTVTNSQAESSAYYNSAHAAEQKVVVAQPAPAVVQYAAAPAAVSYATAPAAVSYAPAPAAIAYSPAPAVAHYAQVQPAVQYVSAPQTVHYTTVQAENHYQPAPQAIKYAVTPVAVQQAPAQIVVAPAVAQVHKQEASLHYTAESHESHAAQYSSGETAVTHYSSAPVENHAHEGHTAAAVQYIQPAPVAVQQQAVEVQHQHHTVPQPAQYLVGPAVQQQYVSAPQSHHHEEHSPQGIRYAAAAAPYATVYAAPAVQKQITSTVIKPVVTKHVEHYVSQLTVIDCFLLKSIIIMQIIIS